MTSPPSHRPDARARRDLWIVLIPSVLLVIAAFAATIRYVKPAPPRSLVLAVPKSEGGARYFAKRYQTILARSGVELELREIDGSTEALKLLADSESDVEAAFVQGGLDIADPEIPIESLASLTYMPLWVFYRGDTMEDPVALRGKRVSLGPARSGTHLLAKRLLEANHAADAPTELFSFDVEASADKMAQGELDAMFLVAPAESPMVRKLFARPGFRVMSFSRAEAYGRLYHYLKPLGLPRGVFDLANDLPPYDVHIVSTTARLVVTEGIHPALSFLLLRAASEVHGGSGLLDREGEFPQLTDGGFTPSAEAKRYFTSGTPFLQRYLPFWAANLVERMWVVLLPLFAVLLPVVRLIPPLYAWRVRRRIYRWYAQLKRIELDLDTHAPLSHQALDDMLVQLDELESAIRTIAAPLPYSESIYAFRGNIDLVRERIRKRTAAA